MFLALSKVVLGEEFSLVHESCASRELSVPCELMKIGSHLGGPSLSRTHYGDESGTHSRKTSSSLNGYHSGSSSAVLTSGLLRDHLTYLLQSLFHNSLCFGRVMEAIVKHLILQSTDRKGFCQGSRVGFSQILVHTWRTAL